MFLDQIDDIWSDRWLNFLLYHFETVDKEENCKQDFFDNICQNPHLTINSIRKNLDNEWNWKYLSSNPRLQPDIILKNLDLPWDWFELSRHPNITSDFIQSYHLLPWDWKGLLQNPNLNFEYFQKYPYYSIDWYLLSQNPRIKWEVLLANSDKKLAWQFLSSRLDISWESILSHPDKEWDWDELSCRKDISWNLVRDNLDRPWNWYYLSKNSGITWEDILNNPDQPWRLGGLSQRQTLRWDFILSNIKECDLKDKYTPSAICYKHSDQVESREYLRNTTNLYWGALSANKDTNLQLILDNPHLAWDWYVISGKNPNVTWNFVRSHLHLPWVWEELVLRDFITIDCLDLIPNLSQNWEFLCHNENIPLQSLDFNYIDSCDWEVICQRQDITFEFLEETEGEWNVTDLSTNWMSQERQNFLRPMIIEYFKPLVTLILKEKEVPLDLVDSVVNQF